MQAAPASPSLAAAMRAPFRRAKNRWKRIRNGLAVQMYPGTKLTLKRRLNYYYSNWERKRRVNRVRSYPLLLAIDAGNVCNLRCPGCLTGLREVSHGSDLLQPEVLDRVLDEIGDRLLGIEIYRWGDPLLHPDIAQMIESAARRGIGTTLSTNFSMPFTAERAEALVRSGLALMGVAIDGASQDTYVQYRVRGDIERVFANIDLMIEAKKKLGSSTPQLIWEYHVFDHNEHEVETARAMAEERGMTIAVSRAWVEGAVFPEEKALPVATCNFLWNRGTMNADGSVAACCGSFYREDDFAGSETVTASRSSFRRAYNNEQFRMARSLFEGREHAPDAARSLICYECPVVVNWDEHRRHVKAGNDPSTFVSRFRPNDGATHLLRRRMVHGSAKVAEIPLTEVSQPAEAVKG